MNNNLLMETAIRTIAGHSLLEGACGVVVAVSGGPDSTALMLLLKQLEKRLGLRLTVWHLNHLIRPEACGEAERVREAAHKLELNCLVETCDVKAFAKQKGLSLQAAGREVRYSRLEKVRSQIGADKIAVGHIADDSVETFFINLLRGAGLPGLTGIAPQNGRIIRPLIDVDRTTIERFLAERGVAYNVDPSNFDKKYVRNRIRHEIIPGLRQINPGFIKTCGATLELLQKDENFLSDQVRETFQRFARVTDNEVVIPIELVREREPALTGRIIRLAINEIVGGNKQDVYFAIQGIMSKLGARKPGEVDIPGVGRAAITENSLTIYRPTGELRERLISRSGAAFLIDQVSISVTITRAEAVGKRSDRDCLLADADKINWPITVRSCRPGDWFVPVGMSGRKKIQDFFVDNKIARHRRRRVPIFTDSDKVVAVGCLRLDERVKLTEATREVAVLGCLLT